MKSWRGIARFLAGGAAIGLLGLMVCRLPAAEHPDAASAESPKAYKDARQRGQLAWERLTQQELKPAEAAQLQAEALRDFRFALTHAPRGAKVDELNAIRCNLAYLYWATEEYYDAAVMGEFLARCYTDSDEAPQGAKITLAAYAKLQSGAASAGDRQFAAGQMTRMAQFITERWPKSSVADEAWTMLIRSAVGNHELNKALEYLNHVATDSPRRAETELSAGQALWTAYLDAMRLPESQRPAKSEMAKRLSQAQTTLQAGVDRLRKSVDDGGEVSYALTAAALSLAQIALDAGQAEKAIAWLDDPKIGPHTLVEAKQPVADRGNFRVETLKAALRAYAAAEQWDAAQQTMDALEKAGGGRLAGIYLSLGRQFEESWKRSQAEGDAKGAAKVAQGFASLLSRLAARPAKETNFGTLNWAAERLMDLGASLDPGDEKPSAEAAGYYQKAADVYRAILDACRADEHYAPQPAMIGGIQLRLARCLRRLGKYSQSMDVLVELLKAQNNLLDAQREAASTYQAWAEEKPSYYLSAIQGGHEFQRKDGSAAFLVWGWGGIARKTQLSGAHEALFHEARYNLALCRFYYALGKSGRQRTELLEQAKRDIVVVYKLYPKMGGKSSYDRYDALLRKIQHGLGVKEQGLKAYEEKS